MKVLRIIARLNVGGPARHVVWLTEGLQRAGHETLLVAGVVPPGEGDMSYVASEAGLTPLIIPQMSREISPLDALTIWKLFRLMRRERPDIVHTHTAKAGTVGRAAGWMYRWLTPPALAGRPRKCFFVHTYHGHIFHSYYGNFKTKVFLTIEKALARMTDRLIVISPQQYREIHEQFGVGRKEQFAIVPIGLDTEVFADWQRRRPSARDELGLKEKDLAVGIVGRLTRIKRHEFFIDAVARYRELFGSAVRFIIIGDGERRDALEAHAAARGVQDDVLFTGMRRDPENFYAALDVVALTSLNEGTPLTLIEAMANARPIIATEVGGVTDLTGERDAGSPQMFRLRERGITVDRDDLEGFCAGLHFLIEQESLRLAMGLRGFEYVRQNYSTDRLLTDVLGLYEALASETSIAELESDKNVRAAK